MATKKRAKPRAQSRASGARKPRTKSRAWRWDARKEQAALLIAEGELSFDEIAVRLNTGRRTLYDWLEHEEFAARVKEHTTRLGQLAERFVIARRAARLSSKQQRWRKLQCIIDARAADPSHARAPGGGTGLLVRHQKMLGSGDNATLVEEFEVDTGLLKEMRDLETESAKECGQWTEKRELTGAGGGPIQVSLEMVLTARKKVEEHRRARLATAEPPPDAS